VARIQIRVNGKSVGVTAGTSVAAALLEARLGCRESVRGEPRAALCGMGICFECAATVDGAPLVRTCRVLCRSGMEISTE